MSNFYTDAYFDHILSTKLDLSKLQADRGYYLSRARDCSLDRVSRQMAADKASELLVKIRSLQSPVVTLRGVSND